MQAKTIPGAVSVIAIEALPCGARCLITYCEGYEGWRRLPRAVTIGGQVFGRSAWNSDRNLAYYRTDRVVAVPTKGGAA